MANLGALIPEASVIEEHKLEKNWCNAMVSTLFPQFIKLLFLTEMAEGLMHSGDSGGLRACEVK